MEREETAAHSSILREEATLYRTNRLPDPEVSLARVRNGLPVDEFEALREMLALSTERLLGLLGMTKSTLSRRRKTGKLSRDESDRLMRFTRLFGLAEKVLGSPDSARRWLSDSAPSLHEETPFDYADTELGAREVEALLWKLEHGVYS